jgi:hypothetical protein
MMQQHLAGSVRGQMGHIGQLTAQNPNKMQKNEIPKNGPGKEVTNHEYP